MAVLCHRGPDTSYVSVRPSRGDNHPSHREMGQPADRSRWREHVQAPRAWPEQHSHGDERDRALRDPPLALLSALAHGKPRTRTAIQIVTAAIYAAISLPDETRMLYLSLLQDALRSTVRKVQSMAP